MLYYCSVVEVATEKFVGAVIVNGEVEASVHALASAIAARALGRGGEFEVLYAPVPPSDIPLPPVGRLLTREALAAHFADSGGLESVGVCSDCRAEAGATGRSLGGRFTR